MKWNEYKIVLIIIILALINIIICSIVYANVNKKIPVHKIERIKVLYELDGIGILCIDGYKWVAIGYDLEQVFIEKDGKMLPERCE